MFPLKKMALLFAAMVAFVSLLGAALTIPGQHAQTALASPEGQLAYRARLAVITRQFTLVKLARPVPGNTAGTLFLFPRHALTCGVQGKDARVELLTRVASGPGRGAVIVNRPVLLDYRSGDLLFFEHLTPDARQSVSACGHDHLIAVTLNSRETESVRDFFPPTAGQGTDVQNLMTLTAMSAFQAFAKRHAPLTAQQALAH